MVHIAINGTEQTVHRRQENTKFHWHLLLGFLFIHRLMGLFWYVFEITACHKCVPYLSWVSGIVSMGSCYFDVVVGLWFFFF